MSNPLLELLGQPFAVRQAQGVQYTPAEIAQQPAVWLAVLALINDQRAALENFLATLGLGTDQPPHIILSGAGTSDYIGACLAGQLRRAWHTEVLTVPSTTLLTDWRNYLRRGQNYLVVSFSRSGDTAEAVASVEELAAHRPDIAHLVITCNAAGRLARWAARQARAYPLVLPDAANDKGLAMTSSFSGMVVAGQALASLAQVEAYAAQLGALSTTARAWLPSAAHTAARLAAENYERVCFIGSGALFGAAREASLKVLELTAGKIFGFAETALGVRHGPLAAVNPNTLIVLFLAAQEPHRRYELALLQELVQKQVGRTRLVITPQNAAPSVALAASLAYPDTAGLTDEMRPPLDVIFGQLLGLFAALQHGLRPDAPSPSGAIGRVVTNIGGI